jgi:hypothetical protein
MYVRMSVEQWCRDTDRESKVLGEEASGNFTLSTTNITAGQNLDLSGQEPLPVLSHASSLKTG